MEILVLTIIFVMAFLSIIGYINKTVKEGDICQCESHPSGCHKKKNASCH